MCIYTLPLIYFNKIVKISTKLEIKEYINNQVYTLPTKLHVISLDFTSKHSEKLRTLNLLGCRGHWTVNNTVTKSFIATKSLDKKALGNFLKL